MSADNVRYVRGDLVYDELEGERTLVIPNADDLTPPDQTGYVLLRIHDEETLRQICALMIEIAGDRGWKHEERPIGP